MQAPALLDYDDSPEAEQYSEPETARKPVSFKLATSSQAKAVLSSTPAPFFQTTASDKRGRSGKSSSVDDNDPL